MKYVGIDYHKKYSQLTAIDSSGKVLIERQVKNEPESYADFYDALDGPVTSVMEASRTWGKLYDMLENLGVGELVLAHPAKVRMIADAKIKTDRIDAGILAQLLRVDLIPSAYIPSKETRSLKDLVRQRMYLVKIRTGIKNRIHVLLDRLHISQPVVSDLFGKRGIRYLSQLELDGIDGEILREDMGLLEKLNELIKASEVEIGKMLGQDVRYEILRSIPGLGAILAAVVCVEIDDIGRFVSPKKLASYCGLVPSTHSSGGKTYHGRLIKMSNKWLRWALVEAAWVSTRNSAYCRTYYERMRRKKSASTAITALARRLSEIVWHVLTEKRPYEERLPHAQGITNKKIRSPLLSHDTSPRGSN